MGNEDLPDGHVIIIGEGLISSYTVWPRKNATLTINNFKKTRDRMKKVVHIIAYKILFPAR